MTTARVELTAYWGNDDAESTITIRSDEWQQICQGGGFTANARSWYEGTSQRVQWHFTDGLVTITGEDGFQALVDTPIDELVVTDAQPGVKLTKLRSWKRRVSGSTRAPTTSGPTVHDEPMSLQAVMEQIGEFRLTALMDNACERFEQMQPSPPPGSFIRGMSRMFRRQRFTELVARHVLSHRRLPDDDDLKQWAEGRLSGKRPDASSERRSVPTVRHTMAKEPDKFAIFEGDLTDTPGRKKRERLAERLETEPEIAIRFFTIVILTSSISSKYRDGLRGFRQDYPSRSENSFLQAFSMMSSDELEETLKRLLLHGLIPGTDLAVGEMMHGEWIACSGIRFERRGDSPVPRWLAIYDPMYAAHPNDRLQSATGQP